MKIICFDIGGTKILKAVVKISGNNFYFLEIAEEKNPRKEDKIRKIILDYCRESRKKYRTKRVALSAAYIVNKEKKIISQGKLCYGTDRFVLSFIENSGFSIRVENDGRCFALGEYFFGKGRNADSLLSITLGTNIGGGFISGGTSFRGAHNSAMEISYLNYFHEKKWQDWDDFCAGEGIEKQYKKASGKFLASKDVFKLVAKKDAMAKKIIYTATEFFGMGIANMLNILDPEMILFGGSISKQREYIRGAVKVAKKNTMNKKANYKFAISSLGNKANLLGAASLFL